MKVSNEKIIEIYKSMKRCRAFEERAIVEIQKGMPGFLHSSVGQEAIPCAVAAFLQPDDYMITTHRGHSDIIARGARFDKVMAELYARETGYCRGISGSMHIAAFDIGILTAVAIVGSGIPIATGVALGCKMKGWNRVTVCFFGDGATCTGSFHEGVGFAASFDLPILFVCQNNQYEESTHWTYWGGKLKNLSDRASGYGIEGISVDGNDAIAMAEAAAEAIEKIRKGKGPILLEGRTYRIHGHHMGDPGTTYRTKEEVMKWKKKDPISRLYKHLLGSRLITEEENKEIESSLSRELDEAVQFALSSPEVDPEVMKDIVYEGREVGLSKL
jgi:TPP-dependent pyruvate/acetoin dehydrogenase alpha subunit